MKDMEMEHDEKAPILDYAWTPNDWELGIGFYLGNIFTNNFTGTLTRCPPGLTIYLGPFCFTLNLGRTILFGAADSNYANLRWRQWMDIPNRRLLRGLAIMYACGLVNDIYQNHFNWGSVLRVIAFNVVVWAERKCTKRIRKFDELIAQCPEARPSNVTSFYRNGPPPEHPRATIRPMRPEEIDGDDHPPKGAS